MDLRSTLAGSRRRVAAAVAVVLLVAVAAAFAAGLLGTPSVAGVENRFGGVNETATVVESNLTVTNPNPVGASLGGLTVDYAVEMNGIRMATGSKEGVSLSTGRSRLPLTTTVANERIPTWWVSHVRNDEETTLTVDAAVHSSTAGASFGAPKVERSVDTDLLSQFDSTETRPVNASSAVASDPVLYVNETRAAWGDVTANATELDVTFVVYNPKPYPVGTTEIGYDIGMNGVALGEGATESGVVIPPGETRTVETTTRIRNGNLDEWWVTHIERNQVSELRIDFSARLDLRATTVEVPLSALTYTKTVETDVFGTKSGANGTRTATPTPGESGERTAEATATPTPTATATPTPTATATDDGGLLGEEEGTATPTPTPTATPTPTPDDDGGLLGDDEATATPTPGATATPTSTPTSTPTDDDGLLGDRDVRVL
jgi:LEA14-like dessication related protein